MFGLEGCFGYACLYVNCHEFEVYCLVIWYCEFMIEAFDLVLGLNWHG